MTNWAVITFLMPLKASTRSGSSDVESMLEAVESLYEFYVTNAAKTRASI